MTRLGLGLFYHDQVNQSVVLYRLHFRSLVVGMEIFSFLLIRIILSIRLINQGSNPNVQPHMQWVWSTRLDSRPKYPCTCLIISLMLTKYTPTTPGEAQLTMCNPDSAQTRDLILSAPMPPKCGMPYQQPSRHANPLSPSKTLSRGTYVWLQFETGLCKKYDSPSLPLFPPLYIFLFPPL